MSCNAAPSGASGRTMDDVDAGEAEPDAGSSSGMISGTPALPSRSAQSVRQASYPPRSAAPWSASTRSGGSVRSSKGWPGAAGHGAGYWLACDLQAGKDASTRRCLVSRALVTFRPRQPPQARPGRCLIASLESACAQLLPVELLASPWRAFLHEGASVWLTDPDLDRARAPAVRDQPTRRARLQGRSLRRTPWHAGARSG